MRSKQLATTDHSDIDELLALADKKKVKFPGNDTSSKVARIGALLADAVFKQAVTHHADYKDEAGNSSTSPKGLVIQVNKRIREAYGVVRNEMNRYQCEHVTILLNDLAAIIANGEELGRDRPEIKVDLYNAIEHSGMDYHWRINVRGDAA